MTNTKFPINWWQNWNKSPSLLSFFSIPSTSYCFDFFMFSFVAALFPSLIL